MNQIVNANNKAKIAINRTEYKKYKTQNLKDIY